MDEAGEMETKDLLERDLKLFLFASFHYHHLHVD